MMNLRSISPDRPAGMGRNVATHSGHWLRGGLRSATRNLCGIAVVLATLYTAGAFAQLDQGSISGVVEDSTGAAVPGAQVALTDTDSGLVLENKTNASGVFVFSPVKIGHYRVSATAKGFETTVQENLILNLDERLNVPLMLKAGAVTETVTITAAPALLQNQEASVNQTFSAQTITNTPLAQRVWVYMAQLSTGVVPSQGTRGGGTGDYEANGQRAEQNNYILDGVDNNVDIIDYMNGSMYGVAPPPDALSEFKLDTADFSAEYGHSAGSVLSVAIKSGTNQIHGDVWEYFRNTALDAIQWNANPLLLNPPYHFNQFGATLGFPIIKNKLFYFGDIQGTRIALASVGGPYSVPTPRMRQGDFSELLTPSNTSGGSCAVVLYQPNSNTGSYTCNEAPTGSLQKYGSTQVGIFAPGQNVFNPATLDPAALKILNMYPLPNANGWSSANNTNASANGKTFNNLIEDLPTTNNTVQWDQRLDWNITSSDQAYARYSYNYVYNTLTPPLGPILDGTGSYAGSRESYLTENFMLSETHIFNAGLINNFRFSYNWGHYENLQPNYDTNEAAALGLGGMPFGAGTFKNGGLPQITVGGITGFGTHGNDPSIEIQNIYQFQDDVTKTLGNHSLKFGGNIQNLRIYFLQPPTPRGAYTYSGTYTGVTAVSNAGFGVADFLVDQMNGNSITNEPIINQQNAYDAAYVEDTWKATPRLTLSYGLRYDYFEPIGEMAGRFANFVPLTEGIGTGTADYVLPARWQNTPNLLLPAFTNLITPDNVTVQYDSNPRLATGQKANFAPRLGIAYMIDPKTVVRTGFGIFYGAIAGFGSNPNIGENYPFVSHAGLSSTTCVAGNAKNQSGITTYCPSLSPTTVASSVGAGQPGSAQNYPAGGQFQNPGDTLEIGLSNQIGGTGGIAGFINSTTINSTDTHVRTPYVMNYNLSVQHSFANNLAATVSYVGNVSRHIETLITSNPAGELQQSGANSQSVEAFPLLGGGTWLHYGAEGNYNSLQAKLEKRYSNGMSYLASYTWAHNLDNSIDPLGGGDAYRMWNIIPISDEVTNDNYDVRQRFTFNGSYELPFGKGREFMHNAPTWADEIAGGWTTDLTFVGQTGEPFTVGNSTISTPSGQQNSRSFVVANPFKTGGSPNVTNPKTTCALSTRNKTNWYNPCSFDNPLNATATPNGNGEGSFPSSPITSEDEAIAYLGGRANTVAGPGYERINMSVSKNFTTWREHYLQVRADVFNLFNHPSLSTPSNTGLTATGGLITTPISFQNDVPDARIFQLSAKYVF
jgi:Carboxypeptidase regulatory-like domain/TonB dependent receptor